MKPSSISSNRRPHTWAAALVAITFVGCTGGDKATPTEAPAPPVTEAQPSVVTPEPAETKEEKNARMEALYSKGEKEKQDSEQTERAAHAQKALSKLTFTWTSAPSFRRAGGKAVLDLDAKNSVPTSSMNADRYKTPAFAKTGQLTSPKSATLQRIKQAFAAQDWLALVNLGGETKYTTYPSISRIDKAVKNLALGVGLRVGRDPYQLHIYYPGPKTELRYLAINYNRFTRCQTIGNGRGTTNGRILQLPDSNEYVLRFFADDIAPSLLSGSIDLKQGPVSVLNQRHVENCEQARARMAAGEIDKAAGEELMQQSEDAMKKAFLALVAKN